MRGYFFNEIIVRLFINHKFSWDYLWEVTFFYNVIIWINLSSEYEECGKE